MKILTKYMLRSHAGPFLFSLVALTGLVFLNSIAIRLQDLIGKGLPAEAVLEFLVYSLPPTIALTLPMAVLVSVLYTFSDLAASSEVTALSAGGIKPMTLMRPVLLAGLALTGGMIYFNDQILPETNHRLRTLFSDIANTSPTLQLKEQIVNPLRSADGTSVVYLLADRIDRRTNELENVRIIDLSANRQQIHRSTHAERGTMTFNESRTDLFLTLHNGVNYEFSRLPAKEGEFQRTTFERQETPFRGLGTEFEESSTEFRGDRELSFGELFAQADNRKSDMEARLDSMAFRSRYAVERALGLIPPDSVEIARSGRLIDLGEGAAEFDDLEGRAAEDAVPGGIGADAVTRLAATTYRQHVVDVGRLRLEENGFRVEIHKKLSIAVACFVFVMIGAPLAVRFPRGGVGMVIASSMAIFAVYYVGLIGGEALADKGVASPVVTMWMSNVTFGLIGVYLLWTMGRETATHRGGGWDDLLYTIGQLFRKPFSRSAEGSTG